MSRLRRALVVSLVSAPVVWALPALLHADTVYLKNGSAIDCTVLGTHEGMVILRIGNVGRIEISEKEIENIEKNDRTGYVDPKKGVAAPAETITKQSPNEDNDPDEDGASEKSAEDGGGGEDADVEGPGGKVEIDADLEKQIKQWATDLTRQKTNYRVRAERNLIEAGPAVVPYVLPLARHPFVRTRVAVYRILKKHGGAEVIEACLLGLEDEDRFVRQLAWQTLKQVSGKSYPFPWDDETATDEERHRAIERWQRWWQGEKERTEEAPEESAPTGKREEKRGK